MKSKLLATLLAGACMMGCLIGSHAETVTTPSAHSEFTRVTDYLFEVTYTEYEQNLAPAMEYYAKRYIPMGCASVQNGKIRGRNYDWAYDESASHVVHVPATETRHASVGVAATTGVTPAMIEAGTPADETMALRLNILPYITLDGINDAGLCVNINVVNAGEIGAPFAFKNDDPSDDVMPLMIPRLILDSCGSIAEAVDAISGMDVYPLGKSYEAHLMISGAKSADDATFQTVVIEFIPDENGHYQLNVIDKFVDDKPIMTNFHLTGFDGTVESLTAHPAGYERYLILANAFDQGKTVSGMLDLMKKVWYSKNYDLYSPNFWYSEATKSSGHLMSERGEAYLGGDVTKAGPFAERIAQQTEDYLNRSRTGGNKTWQTVHTSVYDIEKGELSVLSQECSIEYKFDLNGRIG
ncbi:MAG: hypothetical protein Q4C53_06820 [Clostridia bacterium]|nr:hypothetical protein [Clostridia bacterium]